MTARQQGPVNVPADILAQVRLLEIRTRKVVRNLFAGEYQTAFKGQGMTFSEFREYVPGDDVRSISWTVTARTGKTHIKKFDEEREMTLILAVDVSGSGDFGSQPYFKGEAIVYLSALLGMSASINNDPVGLLLFSDQVELYIPPKKGKGHIQRLLRDLLFHQPLSKKTKFQPMCQHLIGVLKKRAHVFVISDYLGSSFEQDMKMLCSKHHVVSVIVTDPLEKRFPVVGLIDIEDSETGEVMTVDTSQADFRQEFAQRAKKMSLERDQILRRVGCERILIENSSSLVQPLLQYFRRHR